MEQAKRKDTARRWPRFVGRPGDGSDVTVVEAVEDAWSHGSSLADSVDILQRRIATYPPQHLALDNAACLRPPIAAGGRGTIERVYSRLEEEVVFGPRRRRSGRSR